MNIRYKTIFIGSRLDARLLDEEYGSDFGTEVEHDLEAGEGIGGEEGSAPRLGTTSRKRKSRRGDFARTPSRARQQSTRELVDFFAERMQEAQDAWAKRVDALQKRWRTSILSGDWGRRGAGFSDRDAALRLTFGLITRLYAYEDALEDLRLAAEREPSCLEFFAPQVRCK